MGGHDTLAVEDLELKGGLCSPRRQTLRLYGSSLAALQINGFLGVYKRADNDNLPGARTGFFTSSGG